MTFLRKLLIGFSVPLVAVVVAGALAPRPANRTDDALREMKVFSETLSLVTKHYVEEVDFRQLERGAFQGLAESMDPWSSYYDPTHLAPLLARDRSADVGVLLLKHEQQYVRIAAVIPGSPAEIGKVDRGSFIETIDGLETKDLTLYEARAMLSGPSGTKVKLGFFRDSDDVAGKVVELERKDLASLRVTSTIRPDHAAVLRVTDCGPGIAALVRAEIGRLRDAGVQRIVLDLRVNVGGTPEDAAALASLFAGPGPMFQRKAHAATGTIQGLEAQAWSEPLAVLTSRATIGEGELVADALRVRRGVALVGQPTFGKITQQDLVRLSDGTGLWMSIAEYLHADGSALSEKGVEPDEKVAILAGDAEPETPLADDEEAPADADEEPPVPAVDSTGKPASPGGSSPTTPGKASEPKSSPEPTQAPQQKDPQLQRAIEILGGSPVKKAT